MDTRFEALTNLCGWKRSPVSPGPLVGSGDRRCRFMVPDGSVGRNPGRTTGGLSTSFRPCNQPAVGIAGSIRALCAQRHGGDALRFGASIVARQSRFVTWPRVWRAGPAKDHRTWMVISSVGWHAQGVLNTSQRDGLDLHTPASPEGCFEQAEIRLPGPLLQIPDQSVARVGYWSIDTQNSLV